MAKFEMQLPTEVIKEAEFLQKNCESIFGQMTKAGAEVVAENMKNNAPDILKPYVKITKIYKTPSDGGINTKAYISGYIPFSNPNRQFFARRNGTTAKIYTTTEGVPADFLANLYEYGRSTYSFPKYSFYRKSWTRDIIERVMLKEQIRASNGLMVADAQNYAWESVDSSPFD